MTVYLIRHGVTRWNLDSRIQGREDVPLSEEGVRQAERCATELAGRCADIDVVYSSPLSRALDTARIIAEAVGAEVRVDERLIERDFGSVSGKVVDIFNPEWSGEWRGDDMESIEDVAARMVAALRDIAMSGAERAAAVSHGASINALLRELSGGEIGTHKTRLKNACVNVIECSGGRFSVVKYNCDPWEIQAEK